MGFHDPSFTTGTDEQKLGEFRRVRDQIHSEFEAFYRTELLPQMKAR